MADADGVTRGTPATPERMQIGAANATVGDFDVDVGLVEWFRRVRLPDHFTLRGVLVQTHPALECVVGRHVDREPTKERSRDQAGTNVLDGISEKL